MSFSFFSAHRPCSIKMCLFDTGHGDYLFWRLPHLLAQLGLSCDRWWRAELPQLTVESRGHSRMMAPCRASPVTWGQSHDAERMLWQMQGTSWPLKFQQCFLDLAACMFSSINIREGDYSRNRLKVHLRFISSFYKRKQRGRSGCFI